MGIVFSPGFPESNTQFIPHTLSNSHILGTMLDTLAAAMDGTCFVPALGEHVPWT